MVLSYRTTGGIECAFCIVVSFRFFILWPLNAIATLRYIYNGFIAETQWKWSNISITGSWELARIEYELIWLSCTYVWWWETGTIYILYFKPIWRIFLRKCMVCLIHIRLKLYNMIRPKYLPAFHQRLKAVSVRCRATEPWLLTVATTNWRIKPEICV